MRKLAIGSLAFVGVAAMAPGALASNGLESPDNGAYQVGRGGAWLARADDPLAVYFNPAGLVRQSSGVHVGAHLIFLNRCFTRLGQDSDEASATYGQYGYPVSPGNGYPGPGADPGGPAVGPPGTVCEKTQPSPNPQLAVNIRILDRLAIGLGVLGPHGVGNAEWPEELPFTNRFGVATTQPSPQRYLLVKSSSIILFPTLSVSFAVTDELSIGAGFTWGIANASFENFSEATSQAPLANNCGPNNDQPCVAVDDYGRDVRAKLSATDIFVPGLVAGALWSPHRLIDVAGWFRWSDAVDTDASVTTTASYWAASGAKDTDANRCTEAGNPECTVTAGSQPGDPGYNAGHIRLPIPMEAKLGVRFHYPRQTPGEKPVWAKGGAKKVRDAMSEDLFDVEANFTYANDSAVQNLEVRFKPGILINGTGGGTLPVNADIPHNWKDVFGVRLGGEVVVLPSFLSARAGLFYESKGQSDAYLNIDFHNSEKVGLSAGATVRVWRLDITAAYQHTFFGALDNGGNGKVYGLSGDGVTSDEPGAGGPYRTRQVVNGGRLESDLNEVALGVTARF
jgi:long-subunit fatty acid transport protein